MGFVRFEADQKGLNLVICRLSRIGWALKRPWRLDSGGGRSIETGYRRVDPSPARAGSSDPAQQQTFVWTRQLRLCLRLLPSFRVAVALLPKSPSSRSVLFERAPRSPTLIIRLQSYCAADISCPSQEHCQKSEPRTKNQAVKDKRGL